MIIVIRIRGMVDVPKRIGDTLDRMRLRRKYSAVLLKETEENKKLLNHVKDYVSFGKIDEDVLEELIEKRAVSVKKEKIDPKKIVKELDKGMDKLGLKPFFRLHPPRRGIESKKHAGVGKGVLGKNAKINELVRRML